MIGDVMNQVGEWILQAGGSFIYHYIWIPFVDVSFLLASVLGIGSYIIYVITKDNRTGAFVLSVIMIYMMIKIIDGAII